MLGDVTERIESFGYTVTENDSFTLGFIIKKVENSIISDCGIYDPLLGQKFIPEGLKQVAIDMVVGEFLLGKKSIGQLTGFDISAAIKTIQEGDTTVTFAVGDGDSTPEKRLDILINYLMTYGRGKLASYRRIQW